MWEEICVWKASKRSGGTTPASESWRLFRVVWWCERWYETICDFENIWGKETNCAEARAAKWRKMKKKSLACLPPDEDTLYHHLDRVNFLSFILKHYELNHYPSLIGCGWEYINRKCCPVWYAIPAMADVLQPQPQVLIFSSNFANLLTWDFEFLLKRLNIYFIFLKLYLYDHLSQF